MGDCWLSGPPCARRLACRQFDDRGREVFLTPIVKVDAGYQECEPHHAAVSRRLRKTSIWSRCSMSGLRFLVRLNRTGR